MDAWSLGEPDTSAAGKLEKAGGARAEEERLRKEMEVAEAVLKELQQASLGAFVHYRLKCC